MSRTKHFISLKHVLKPCRAKSVFNYWCLWTSWKFSSHGRLLLHHLAASTAEEANHHEERENPERASHEEIISHSPNADIPRLSHWSHANSIVLWVQDGTSGDKNAELEQADEPSEVCRADSEEWSPCANKHAKSVKADERVDNVHEDGNDRKLRSSCLAVNITSVYHVNVVFDQVAIHFCIIPLVSVRHS